jgi:hypothetical protein
MKWSIDLLNMRFHENFKNEYRGLHEN